MQISIIGCGYTGSRIAELEKQSGNSVTCYVQSAESERRLKKQGLDARRIELDRETLNFADDIGTSEYIYYLVPPQPQGQQDERLNSFLNLLQHSSSFKQNATTRIVLISTTGVYGNREGEWVTEQTPPNPVNLRSQRRLDAEQQIKNFAKENTPNLSAVILRVAGIYGPGRLPIERVKNGIPVISEDEAPFSNRIHVDDLAYCCYYASRNSPDNEIYNVADGNPSKMSDYFNSVADLLDLPRPPVISMEQARQTYTEMQMSFLNESRKVSNQKLKKLGISLKYETLSQGLAASI